MTAIVLDYFGDWQSMILKCPECGWEGTFEEGIDEYYDTVMDSSCPKCPYPERPMLAVVG